MSVEPENVVVPLRRGPEPVPDLPIEQPDPEFWGHNLIAKAKGIGSRAVLCTAVASTGAVIAGMEIGAHSRAAGHDITTTATTDGYLHAHGGLLGSLHIPMKNFPRVNSHGLGATIDVGETDDVNGGNVKAYSSLMANIDPDVNEAELALLKLAAEAGVASIVMFWAISKSKLINPKYKEWSVGKLGSENTMRLALAGLVALPGVLLPVKSAFVDEKPEANVSHKFDGTALENARATGWMKVLVNKFGVEVLNRVDAINGYSDGAVRNLHRAYRSRVQPFNTEGTVSVIGFDGVKCNPAVMPVIGEVLKLTDADFAVSAGDDVLAQKNFDGLCLDRLATQTKGTELVMFLGDHATSQTAKQAREQGITVPKEGEVIERDGLLITGGSDPYPYSAGEEQPDVPGFPARVELGQKVAKVACAQDKLVSIVALNQPRAADQVASSGCVSTVMTGGENYSDQSFTAADGTETTYIQEISAGGATYEEGDLNVKTLEAPTVPIDLYHYQFDKKTGKLLYFEAITVNPDESVDIPPAPTLTTFALSAEGRKILFGK